MTLFEGFVLGFLFVLLLLAYLAVAVLSAILEAIHRFRLDEGERSDRVWATIEPELRRGKCGES